MDELKKDFLAGSQKVIVGSKNLDLVLRTLNKVYVQQGNKLITLQDLLNTNTSSSSSEITSDEKIKAHNSDPNAHPAIQDKIVQMVVNKYQLPLIGKANIIYFTTDIGATYIWDTDKYILVGQDLEKINVINGNIW